MGKTREIKGRMKAVANIERITKTMQMIATARRQASQQRAIAAQPYARKIAELVGELSASVGQGVGHPLLQSPSPRVGRQLLLVLTSNRGLCGGYNASILRQSTAFLREHADDQVDLEVVGKKGLGYFKFAGRTVDTFHSQFTDNPVYEDVERLADRYIQGFSQGTYDAIHVAYMTFHSIARQSAKVVQLLPLERPGGDPQSESQAGGGGAQVGYDFSPGPADLLGELLPVAVKTQLFQWFNEAIVGEHIARMIAMKSATDAAGKMRKELGRTYNRARQTAITTELTEIIGGAAALA